MPVATSGALPEDRASTSLYWSGITDRSTSMPVSGVKRSSISFCMICTYWLDRFTHTCRCSGSVLAMDQRPLVNDEEKRSKFLVKETPNPAASGRSVPSWYSQIRSIARLFFSRLSTVFARYWLAELPEELSSPIRYGISSGLSARLSSWRAAISMEAITATFFPPGLQARYEFSSSRSLCA